jgi:anti-anti-sigma factor
VHDDRPPPPYALERRDDGPVTIVAFTIRRIIGPDDVQAIGESLESIVENEGRTRLVLDLGRVDFPSSAFLGRILWILIKLKSRGGRLALCGLSPELLRVFPADRPSGSPCLGVFPTLDAATLWAGEGAGDASR